jgi:hypothetical protein
MRRSRGLWKDSGREKQTKFELPIPPVRTEGI